jgi:2-oxoisovalerate dehydrogenase E1 component
MAESVTSIEVIDLRSLSPSDRDAVMTSLRKTNRVIAGYEDSFSWGYGAEIAAAIADECVAWLDAPVRRVASADAYAGYPPQVEDATLPQIADFVEAVEEIIGW